MQPYGADAAETVKHTLPPGDSGVNQSVPEQHPVAAGPDRSVSSPAGSSRPAVARKDVLLATLLFAVDVAIAALFAYDLFGKAFGLIHNRCTAKKDFSVQCEAIRPAGSALWGLLIGGGGMALALGAGLVLAAVAAMTGRRAWWWTAAALPMIAVCGGIGHLLVGNAVN
ncbi:hypothetical protein [Nocardia sp. NBC_01327]|uniref:hypothetical protein n=1 Tax=Nocardia sp. NBC_01327 TaxID=2903593 RepID=UPI002E12726A|nr:hypothetical protein OG326_01345 [Nocardia sp. NBC_01327]